MLGAAYDVQSSTSSTAAHHQKPVKGHSVGPNGAIPIESRDSDISGAVGRLAVFKMRSKGTEVTQEVANEMVAGFSTRQSQEALKDWVAADNQSWRVTEKPQFRRLIEAAYPLAEAVLWRNHQSPRDSIIAEYHAYIPAVAAYLRKAQSLIYVSFDNWTSTSGQLALTGICVHHLDSKGRLIDYMLGLPELHGAHNGNNIASVVAATLRAFDVNEQRVWVFCTR